MLQPHPPHPLQRTPRINGKLAGAAEAACNLDAGRRLRQALKKRRHAQDVGEDDKHDLVAAQEDVAGLCDGALRVGHHDVAQRDVHGVLRRLHRPAVRHARLGLNSDN